MPSFDVVSKLNHHEVTNAVDQANRELKNRFDFKDTSARFEFSEATITMVAPSRFQLQQMLTILESKLVKRNIELECLEPKEIAESLHETRQQIEIRHGIDHELGKKIGKLIRESQLKLQTSLMGDQVRVTGKQRDELQKAMALLRQENFKVPLQFENFRD